MTTESRTETGAGTEPGGSAGVWMRWRYPGLIAVGILVMALVLFVARGALFPFILSIIVAELLYPLVEFLERWVPGRRRFPTLARVVSILLIYAVFIAVIGALLYLTVSSIINEGQKFIEAAPDLFEQASASAEEMYSKISDRIPEEFVDEVKELLEGATGVVASAASGIALSLLSSVISTVSFVVGLIVVPILLFYLLKDKDALMNGMYEPFASSAEMHTRNVLSILHGVIGSYIRAQLLSVSVVGVLVFIGLSLLGIEFALILGILAAVFAIIPIVGAIIGAVPGLLIALASDPDKIIWVAAVYVIAQLIESNVVTPRLQAHALRLHPVVVMAIIVLSAEIAGIWGMVVGVPLSAAARDVFSYFRRQWRPAGADTAVPETPEPSEEPLPTDGE